MKKGMRAMTLQLISKAAFSTAEKEANSKCAIIGYEPKEPTELKKLRKF